MSNRYANLENNLTTLQDLIKRDSASYRDEFLEQYRHYENTLKLFQLQPNLDSAHLIDVITFLSQVSHCYPTETKCLSTDIAEILKKNGEILDPHLRLALCKCLVVLRTKNLATPLSVLELFFDLLKNKDKTLRKFIYDSTISFAKRLNTTKKGSKSANVLQNYVFKRLQDNHAVVARSALLICIDLYRRRIWQDAKTANAISRACFNRVTKIFLAACKFFLGRDVFDEQGDVSSDDDDPDGSSANQQQKTVKEILVGYRVGKKTRHRKKRMEKAKESLNKVTKKHGKKSKLKTLDFSALHYLNDPQEFAENLLKKLDKNADRFEVKLILMALIARIVGLHKLQVLNFYPFLQKYLQPHQRDVTKILLFAAQSSHDLVPPDVIQNLLKTIVNNFVSDRNSTEAIAVGLNSVREIADKCPLAIDEDLLQDLVEYKKYKNKNVSMSAKSLIQTFRNINPTLLKKRDRGKPTEAMKEIKPPKYFAESKAFEFIPGAECLIASQESDDKSKENDEISEGDEWEEEEGEDETSDDDDDDDGEWNEIEESTLADDQQSSDETKKIDDAVTIDAAKESALLLSETRIFTQQEFRKIAAHQLKKHVLPAKGRKRKAEENSALEKGPTNDDADENSDADSEDSRGELPRLKDIEHLHKRPKHDKAARMETVKAGREGREKFGRPKKKGSHVGRTNKKIAKKNKAFSMVKQKQTKKIKKRSFRDKQQSLRTYLIKQKKMR